MIDNKINVWSFKHWHLLVCTPGFSSVIVCLTATTNPEFVVLCVCGIVALWGLDQLWSGHGFPISTSVTFIIMFIKITNLINEYHQILNHWNDEYCWHLGLVINLLFPACATGLFVNIYPLCILFKQCFQELYAG